MASKDDKSLSLEVEETPQAAVVHLQGSASMNEADRIRSALSALAEKRIQMIVLDLGQMDFICSAGLGAIISAHLKSRHHSGQIRLANPQPAVMKLLETTRLTKLFPVFADVEQAIRA